eukprot:g43698.t1
MRAPVKKGENKRVELAFEFDLCKNPTCMSYSVLRGDHICGQIQLAFNFDLCKNCPTMRCFTETTADQRATSKQLSDHGTPRNFPHFSLADKSLASNTISPFGEICC